MSRSARASAIRLRSPRVMLIAFIALLAMPSWVTTLAIAAAGLVVAGRLTRSAVWRWRQRRSDREGAIRLGVGRDGRAITVGDRELSAHGLILGASGAGKTTALLAILDQQISRGMPVAVIDMKGSPTFAAHLARTATAAGRPFRLWTPDGPGFWNPLQHGNATEGKDKLISTERFTEPHYQRAAERYVQNLLQVLAHVHPDRAPTLEEVVALMDTRRLPVLLRDVPKDLSDRVQDYCSAITPDQLSAIRGLQTRLALITESAAGAYLKPPGEGSIDLRAALGGRDVVLFSLNSSRYGTFAAQLGTLVVQDLICATGLRLDDRRAGAPVGPAMIAIDEFSGIGGDHVVALFARGREAGVHALVATQELADLDRAGRGVRDQVLGSTAFKLVLRQDVPESAQIVAQIAGTERVWEETHQLGGTLFPGPPGRGTRREVERFVIDPNDVKSLQTGQAVLISKLRGGPAQVIRVTPPAAESPGPAAASPTPADDPPAPANIRPQRDSSKAGRARRDGDVGRRAIAGRPGGRRQTDSRRYPDPGVTR